MIDQPAARGVDRRVVLLVAATASFLTPFMAASVNIALPTSGVVEKASSRAWRATRCFLRAFQVGFFLFGALCCAGILASLPPGKVRETASD